MRNIFHNEERHFNQLSVLRKQIEEPEHKSTCFNSLDPAVLDSELRYRRLFETAQDGIFLLDAETGQITDANPFLIELLHYTLEELVGKKLWEVMFFRDSVLAKESFTELQRVGYVRYEDLALETIEGNSIDVEFVGNVYLVGSQKVIQCNIRDISKRKKAENRQQLAMEILKLLNQQGETKNLIMSLFHKIQEYTGIEAVGIRLREGGDYPYFSTNGFPQHFVESENDLCRRGPDGQIILDAHDNPCLECMCGNVIMKRTDPTLPFFTEHGSFWTNSTSELLTSTTEKDGQSTTRNRCNNEGYESVALIPLCANREIIGLLQLNDKRVDRFTLDFIRFFEGIGDSICIAFEQQRRVDRVRKALGASIQAITSLVEARDPYTAGHQQRVAELARAIATEMDFDADRIDGIRVASVIHDIGKISVPAEILSKPTKLTDIEFSLIKVHSEAGYNILKDMEFPWPVARMVLEHHERTNGSGYPHGLTNGQSLIESRILAVADVVESMASHRPYRLALGIDAALEEIKSNEGILYDPQASDACLKIFTEKGFTWTV